MENKPRPPSKRLEAIEKKRLEKVRKDLPQDLSHFGVDFTSQVKEAMEGGGKLPKDQRDDVGDNLKKRKLSGKSLSDVLPKSFVSQIEDRFNDKGVSQLDGRKKVKTNEEYEGNMFTSTYVNPPSGLGSEKDIPMPSSPRSTHLDTGEAHRAHTSPFSLAGLATNNTKTVWTPQWANIGLDTRLEKAALQSKKGGNEVVHFRFDTDKRSTVGIVEKNKKGGFSSMTMQYQRRPEGDKK